MTTIAIDCTPAIRQNAGIGRIIEGQVRALLEQAPEYDVRLFVTGTLNQSDRLHVPAKLHATPISERNMVRIWHRLNSPLPSIEWFTGGPLDLFHATDFVLAPSRARIKFLTIHDLAFRFYPEAAMPGLHRYLNVVVPRSIERAHHILADSHNTANDLESEWKIPPEKITVVQGAVDHNRYHPDDDLDTQRIVRQQYGIRDGPFILALSTLQPRKNFVRLIEAFHAACQEQNLPHQLIIGGKKGWLYDEIFDKVKELGLMKRVIFPGFVAETDLPILYRAAEFFAYPSLYEGFGIPIVEALACGTPVLTANNSCLPEAGGPGAIYVDAESVDSIADGLVRLACSQELRERLQTDGLTYAKQFTWSRSGKQLLDAYRRMLD